MKLETVIIAERKDVFINQKWDRWCDIIARIM